LRGRRAGPELNVPFLSDDVPRLLRFTGTFAAINVIDVASERLSAGLADVRVRSTAPSITER
jgi:hypothetical protein